MKCKKKSHAPHPITQKKTQKISLLVKITSFYRLMCIHTVCKSPYLYSLWPVYTLLLLLLLLLLYKCTYLTQPLLTISAGFFQTFSWLDFEILFFGCPHSLRRESNGFFFFCWCVSVIFFIRHKIKTASKQIAPAKKDPILKCKTKKVCACLFWLPLNTWTGRVLLPWLNNPRGLFSFI